MSFLRKLFGGGSNDEPPSVPPPQAAEPVPPPADASKADLIVDCSALDWRGDEQVPLLKQILAPSALLGIADLLASDQFAGNPWCSPIDGLILYAMAAHLQPGRIMEIGSGYTTRVLRQVKEDYMLSGELITIDPDPRVEVVEDVDAHLASPIQEIPLDDFQILQAGEMVFIDSTHSCTPGSDADHIISRILPALPLGVIVGFHGIRLPRNYTAEELVRRYNEQEKLLQFMSGHKSLKVLLSGGWLWENRRDAIAGALPSSVEPARPSFLWFQV